MTNVGRPRKETLVSESVIEPVPNNFDKMAISIIREDGKYVVIVIPLDSVTLKTGEGVKHVYDSRYEANERFKIMAINEIFNKVES